MVTSSSPPPSGAAVARRSSSHHHHHHHRKRDVVVKRKHRRGDGKRSKHRYASSSDHAAAAAASSSSSSTSDSSSDSSDDDSESSSSSGGDHRSKRRSVKRKHHHHHRDESSSDSDSDDSRKRRRKDTSKKVKERRKESSNHKEKKHSSRRKEKSKKDGAGPVQLSKFLGRDKDNGVRRSVVSGKKCLGVADTNEGGEDERRQAGRDESHGTFEVSQLQLRLSPTTLVDIIEDSPTWRCWYYFIALTFRLCCLLHPHLLLDVWLLSSPTKKSLLFPRALNSSLVLSRGVRCFLCQTCTEGTQIREDLGGWFSNSPGLNLISCVLPELCSLLFRCVFLPYQRICQFNFCAYNGDTWEDISSWFNA